MGELGWAFLRLLVAVPLVAALAYFSVRYGLGQRQQLFGGRYLRVVEQVSLSRQARVAVLRAGGRYLLIGCGEGGVTLLAELPDYAEPPAGENGTRPAWLERWLSSGRNGEKNNDR